MVKRKGFRGVAGGGGGNMQGFLKQAQKMQSRIQETQESIESHQCDAQAGGGVVKIVMDGKYRVVSLEIDKEVIDPEDKEMLQDLVTAAINEVTAKVQEYTKDKLGSVTGGMNIPGLF
jgi:nucleoid-associated protein EbfC